MVNSANGHPDNLNSKVLKQIEVRILYDEKLRNPLVFSITSVMSIFNATSSYKVN